jgi:hypothetical protein
VKPKFVLAVLLACSATAARAQSAPVRPMPAVGELIRVSPADGQAFTGSLAALGGDTMMLKRAGDSVMVQLSAQPLDVRRRHRETWSGLGALTGLAAGLLASRVERSSGRDGGVRNASHAVVGGAAGAIVGGLTGFFVAPERWQRLTLLAPRRLPPPITAQAGRTLTRADTISWLPVEPKSRSRGEAAGASRAADSSPAPAAAPDTAATPPAAPPEPAPAPPPPPAPSGDTPAPPQGSRP